MGLEPGDHRRKARLNSPNSAQAGVLQWPAGLDRPSNQVSCSYSPPRIVHCQAAQLVCPISRVCLHWRPSVRLTFASRTQSGGGRAEPAARCAFRGGKEERTRSWAAAAFGLVAATGNNRMLIEPLLCHRSLSFGWHTRSFFPPTVFWTRHARSYAQPASSDRHCHRRPESVVIQPV